MHYWLVLHPDVSRPIGGAKQMHRLAEAIVASGRTATIIQDQADFHPGWFKSSVQTISYCDWTANITEYKKAGNNILVFPETFIEGIADYCFGLPCVIFNQNASYTFGLPGSSTYLAFPHVRSLYNQSCIKHVLCVSSHDYRFLSENISLSPGSVSRIVNGLEDSVFVPFSSKKKQLVFMPRKNFLDAHVVTSLLSSHILLHDWSIVEIDGLSHSQVLSTLRSSLIFLSFGHPEGFGLPVAEAMASGCAVVGYSGLGGRELFELARVFDMAEEVSLGDWNGFVNAVVDFERSFSSSPDIVSARLRLVSNSIKSAYNMDSMKESVRLALEKIEMSL